MYQRPRSQTYSKRNRAPLETEDVWTMSDLGHSQGDNISLILNSEADSLHSPMNSNFHDACISTNRSPVGGSSLSSPSKLRQAYTSTPAAFRAPLPSSNPRSARRIVDVPRTPAACREYSKPVLTSLRNSSRRRASTESYCSPTVKSKYFSTDQDSSGVSSSCVDICKSPCLSSSVCDEQPERPSSDNARKESNSSYSVSSYRVFENCESTPNSVSSSIPVSLRSAGGDLQPKKSSPENNSSKRNTLDHVFLSDEESIVSVGNDQPSTSSLSKRNHQKREVPSRSRQSHGTSAANPVELGSSEDESGNALPLAIYFEGAENNDVVSLEDTSLFDQSLYMDSEDWSHVPKLTVDFLQLGHHPRRCFITPCPSLRFGNKSVLIPLQEQADACPIVGPISLDKSCSFVLPYKCFHGLRVHNSKPVVLVLPVRRSPTWLRSKIPNNCDAFDTGCWIILRVVGPNDSLKAWRAVASKVSSIFRVEAHVETANISSVEVQELLGHTPSGVSTRSATRARQARIKPKPLIVLEFPLEHPVVSITNEDLECLRPDTFLNDSIIDFYLQYLLSKLKQELRDSVFCFSTFFYRKLVKDGNTYSRVGRWARGHNIFNFNFVFVPVNEGAHWYLIIVCLKSGKFREAPCLLQLNSLETNGPSQVTYRLRRYLSQEYNAQHCSSEIASSPSYDSSDHSGVHGRQSQTFKCDNLPSHRPKIPGQNNYSDCGVFLLRYAELFIELQPSCLEDFSSWNHNISPECIAGKRSDLRTLILDLGRENKSKREFSSHLNKNSVCSIKQASPVPSFEGPEAPETSSSPVLLNADSGDSEVEGVSPVMTTSSDSTCDKSGGNVEDSTCRSTSHRGSPVLTTYDVSTCDKAGGSVEFITSRSISPTNSEQYDFDCSNSYDGLKSLSSSRLLARNSRPISISKMRKENYHESPAFLPSCPVSVCDVDTVHSELHFSPQEGKLFSMQPSNYINAHSPDRVYNDGEEKNDRNENAESYSFDRATMDASEHVPSDSSSCEVYGSDHGISHPDKRFRAAFEAPLIEEPTTADAISTALFRNSDKIIRRRQRTRSAKLRSKRKELRPSSKRGTKMRF